MSLRTRLGLGVGLVVLVALAATDLIVRAELRSSLYSRLDSALATSTRTVASFTQPEMPDHGEERPGPVGSGGGSPANQRADRDDDGPEPQQSFCDFVELSLSPDTFVEVRTVGGAPVGGLTCAAHVGSSTYLPKLPAQLNGLGPVTGPQARLTYFSAPAAKAGGPDFQVAAGVVPGPRQVIVAEPLTSTERTLDQLLSIELIVSGAALVVGVLLGWLLVRLGLRPLRDIERTADAIAAGELTSRVPGANARTEVGHVATALNVMLTRIEEAFAERDATEAELRASEERLRRFVGDASHELRTPIAAVSAYAELSQQPATQLDDQARAIAGIRSETARMQHLVEDLLLLARLDEGRPLERRPAELVGVATEAIETALAVGPQWPLHLVALGPVEVVGDALRLRQVIDNLLANVRSHTPPGTETEVRVRLEGELAVVEVADSGPGMSPEDAAHAFDRFYRADPSRARTRGGAGLGLAIVASIVGAHGGHVEVASTPGSGTAFRVALPASPPDPAADDLPEGEEEKAPEPEHEGGTVGDRSSAAGRR